MNILGILLTILMGSNITFSQFCTDTSTCINNKICLNFLCLRCHSDFDCASVVPAKPYCNTMGLSGNSCEECLINSHCPSPFKSLCSGNICSPCVQQSDCSHISGGKNQCLNGVCVGCYQNSQCSSGVCDTTTNQCQGSACPCSLSSNTPYCSGSYCTGCGASQTFCSSMGLNCAPDGSCQQCWEDQQCTSPNLSICAGNSCNICLNDNNCAHISGKNRCLASQGCVECLSDLDCAPGETCTNNACLVTSQVPFTITLSYTQFPDIYTIDFPVELVTNAQVEQGIAIELVGIDPTLYSYSIVKLTETQYEIHFQVTETIPATQLHLVYTYYSQVGYNINSQSHWYAQIPSKRIPFITVSDRQVCLAIQLAGKTVTVVFTMASAFVLLLGGNPMVLWLLIGLIQTFYYLIFINVNYPANVQFFFRIFALGKLDFIPNPMTWIDPNIDQESLPAPARFEEYDVNALFLEESGSSLLLAFGVFIIYGISFFIKNVMNRLSRSITLLFTKISLWFRWSGALRGLISSYPDLAQTSFLQIRELDFRAPIYSASSVFGIIFLIYVFGFPVFTFLLVRKLTKDNRKVPRKFIGLVEDYASEGTYPKYFTSVFLGKRLLIALIIVFLHDYPYIEIAFLIILSSLTIFLLVNFKPYPTKDLNISNIVTEVLFLIIHILIFVLIHDDHIRNFTEQARLDIGWVLIGIGSIIIMINLRGTVIEIINTLKENWSLVKKVLKLENNSKKVVRVRGIFPLGKLSPKDISHDIQPESIDTSTPKLSSSSNFAIIDTIPFMKKRKVERAGGGSVTIDHLKGFKMNA